MCFLLISGYCHSSPAPAFKVSGMRVDISYLYKLHPDKSVKELAAEIVANSKKGSINTLFVYAFSNVYGAFYPTTYKYAPVEKGFGIHNILKEITVAAKKNGIRVVAVVPVNNFKDAWDKNPGWRAKTKDGKDYVPAEGSYLLSVWHPEFRKWLKGLYEDLLARNPGVEGLEALEPSIDFNWHNETDYNPVLMKKFLAAYPTSEPGSPNWYTFKARGLTEVISIMNSCAHTAGKKSYMVHTWPAKANGDLISGDELKKNTGVDLKSILGLKGASKLDYLVTELIWQQWAAEYGIKKFSEFWPKRAAKNVIKFVNNRSGVMIHIEPTPFRGATGFVTPSLKEFSSTLGSLRKLKVGIGVYDYSQMEILNAWSILASAN